MSDWKEFLEERLCGIFWVCGTYPETDGDVNDFGETVWWHTGKLNQFVSLVYLDFDPDTKSLFVEPVSDHGTGGFDDEYSITHYMQFKKPKHVINGKSRQEK